MNLDNLSIADLHAITSILKEKEEIYHGMKNASRITLYRQTIEDIIENRLKSIGINIES